MNNGTSRHHLNRRSLLKAIASSAAIGIATQHPARAQHGDWSRADGLRIAGPVAGLETLDPALGRDLQTNFLIRQVFRGLVFYDAELLPVPALAATIDVSDDQMRYTFTLREDARFHDGRAVEAEDVAWSLSRALHPATAERAGMSLAGTTFLGDIEGAASVLSGETDQLSGVEVVDARTVRVTLVAPSTTFVMRLASVPASILDRFQDTSAPDWWKAANGSGPYRVESVDPASSLQLVAADSWPSGDVAVQDVSVRLGLEASAAENLLQSGEIDLLDDASPGLVPLLLDPATGLNGYQLFEMPQFALGYVSIGGWQEPLDDIHIRRAIQFAFDVPAYIDGAVGEGVMVPEGVIPHGVLGRAWRIDMPVASVEAARAEVAASRYGAPGNVPTIRIHAADVSPVEAMRDVIGTALGLRIEAVKLNWTDFLDGLGRQKWDAYSVYWGMDYPDPEALLGMLWSSESPDNYSAYHNPQFDELLAASRIESDEIRRQDLYMQAQQVLIDDVAVIPLYVPTRYTLARPGFEYVPATAMGLLGLEMVR